MAAAAKSAHIQSLLSESDLLWRMANQSLLATLLGHIKRELVDEADKSGAPTRSPARHCADRSPERLGGGGGGAMLKLLVVVVRPRCCAHPHLLLLSVCGVVFRLSRQPQPRPRRRCRRAQCDHSQHGSALRH
jgi:hypothetical protein